MSICLVGLEAHRTIDFYMFYDVILFFIGKNNQEDFIVLFVNHVQL